jgi:adenosylmethionine-8-amino-7-oxononanoate aminotransferase
MALGFWRHTGERRHRIIVMEHRGALPLAVTLCRGEIFDAHYATDRRRTFFHSSSFTANPIACAGAACRYLRLIAD